MDCTRYIHKLYTALIWYCNACRCPNTPMVERPRDDVSDGVSWYCPQCYTQIVSRTAEVSNTPVHMCQANTQSQMPVKRLKLGNTQPIDIYQWLREVCSTALVNGPPIILGGQQTIVQIDESLFHHKPKVRKCVKLSTID